MGKKIIIFILIALFAVSGSVFFTIVNSFSPNDHNTFVIWGFFISIFGICLSVLTPIWHGIKTMLLPKSFHIKMIASMRQAALISAVITATTFLRSLNILSLWDILPLLVAAILIEFFFQSDKTLEQPVNR